MQYSKVIFYELRDFMKKLIQEFYFLMMRIQKNNLSRNLTAANLPFARYWKNVTIRVRVGARKMQPYTNINGWFSYWYCTGNFMGNEWMQIGKMLNPSSVQVAAFLLSFWNCFIKVFSPPLIRSLKALPFINCLWTFLAVYWSTFLTVMVVLFALNFICGESNPIAIASPRIINNLLGYTYFYQRKSVLLP